MATFYKTVRVEKDDLENLLYILKEESEISLLNINKHEEKKDNGVLEKQDATQI